MHKTVMTWLGKSREALDDIYRNAAAGRIPDGDTQGTAILAGSEQVYQPQKLEKYIIMGELSLDGKVKPIKGALPIAIQARKALPDPLHDLAGVILDHRQCSASPVMFVDSVRRLRRRTL